MARYWLVFILVPLLSRCGIWYYPTPIFRDGEVWEPLPPETYDAYIKEEEEVSCLVVRGVDAGGISQGCKVNGPPPPQGTLGVAMRNGTYRLIVATANMDAAILRVHVGNESRTFSFLDRNNVKVAAVLLPAHSLFHEILDADGNVLFP